MSINTVTVTAGALRRVTGLGSALTGGFKLVSGELSFQKRFRDVLEEKVGDAAAGVGPDGWVLGATGG